ncbi:MAG: beta-ketoacyl-[acyl-carrier-protein] synthase family protein [Fibrobacterota bacterium]
MRRVVITGAGAVTPIGSGMETFWRQCLDGQTSVDSIPPQWLDYAKYTSTIRAPLPDSLIPDTHISRIEKLQLDRVSIIAIEAACEALTNAGYYLKLRDEKKNIFVSEQLDGQRTGVFMGTGIGGAYSFLGNNAHQIVSRSKKNIRKLASQLQEKQLDSQAKQAFDIDESMMMPARFNPFVVSMIMPNAVSANTGIKLGLRAENETICCACASGTVAVGKAFEAIRAGKLDTAVAGGAEYVHDEYGGIFRGFDSAKTLVQNCDYPQTANRPFDRDRSGFLFAQGAGAALVLEERNQALKRDAPVIAEVIGFQQSFDAHNIMIMEPRGSAIESMIRKCLAEAGIPTENIDYINAHGTGTQVNDSVEAAVIERVFGRRPAINSTKSLVGHTIGASGAIEAAVTALSLHHGMVHPSLNLDNPVAPLNFIHKKTVIPMKYALSQSFAFGGHNAVLAMTKHQI